MKPALTKVAMAIATSFLLVGCGGGNTITPSPVPEPVSPAPSPAPAPSPSPTPSQSGFDNSLDFSTIETFSSNLLALSDIEDAQQRGTQLNDYWQQLIDNQRVPFATDDGACFLFRSDTTSSFVIHGDWSWFSGNPQWPANPTPPITGSLVEGTDLWVGCREFPADARLDYQLAPSGGFFLDPNNPRQQLGGFGYNSYFAMPDYAPSPYKTLQSGINAGSLSDDILIRSGALGYDVNYRVYTPAGYEAMSDLPTLYFTDGHEYLHDELGAAVTTLNNLIAEQQINPVIAVFIDPRHPSTGNNQRDTQYFIRPSPTSAFIADELVRDVDSRFRTSNLADDRAIFGTSLGGMFSTYVCFHEADIFGMCGIHSPAVPHDETLELIRNGEMITTSIALSLGNVGDFLQPGRDLRDLLQENGYTPFYSELSQGHSWGNWSDSLADMLIFLLNE